MNTHAILQSHATEIGSYRQANFVHKLTNFARLFFSLSMPFPDRRILQVSIMQDMIILFIKIIFDSIICSERDMEDHYG